MNWVYWIYGIDLTHVITPILKDYDKDNLTPEQIAAENDLKHDYELMGNILLIQETNVDNRDPQYYIGIGLAEWGEIEEQPTKPTEELIPEHIKEQVNNLINRIKTNCPFISSKVECTPQIFLSRSVY